MSAGPKSFALILVSLLLAATTSCNRGPSAVKQPSISASSAGKLAMEQYDTNADGKVAADELGKAPALKAALPRMDTDSDKAISADEVAARINVWHGMQTGLTSFNFTVTLDGSPLSEATVTFEPEKFLGDDIKPAVATTNINGRGAASIPKELRADPKLAGMQIGLYRVKISKLVNGKETVPAKYNTDTVLGQEAALDVSEIAGNRVVYALTTK